jgi:flagellar biosynthesis/type III secretory pathway M-ring protein FliF/YscJ
VEITFTNDGLIGIAIIFGVFIVIFLIVREIRLMRTNSRKMEIELEREKLSVLKQDTTKTGPSMLRLEDSQLSSLRNLEDLNFNLDKDLFVKQKLVEGRIQKLEGMIKSEKLDRMLYKIQEEEKKIV